MVVVELLGGLGNQMFQYALGRRLAFERACKLKLDLSGYADDAKRSYRLDRFAIVGELATRQDVAAYFRAPRLLGRIRISRVSYSVAKEKADFVFDPTVLQQPGNLYLKGYWQNEKYFGSIEQVLRAEFRSVRAPHPTSLGIADRIEKVEGISLHVRRGDYVHDGATKAYHGVLPLEYYEEALDRVASQVAKPHIFIFSDEPEWVRNNLRCPYPGTIVGHNGEERDYEDLWLMSLCKHHIIANSSFSWWGAWLGANPRKIVIAPKKWIASSTIDDSDVTPAAWIRI